MAFGSMRKILPFHGMTVISPGQIDIFLPNNEKIKERHVKNILKVRQ